MANSQPHRKQVRHYDEPGHVHELTFSCYKRLPLLTNDTWRALLAESINRATARHKYNLTAFVFMPEHVHLIVYPLPEASGISSLLRAIKRPASYRIKKLLEDHRNPLLKRLTIRQRPGVETFRFWQEGPGYDRNLTNVKPVQAAIDSVHENPVRRGLCERASDWRWSSARFYVENLAERDEALPTIVSLPAHWLDEGGIQNW